VNALDGGGALALNPQGVFNLVKWLLDGNNGYAAKLEFKAHSTFNFLGILIRILWIGIGYAEEAILILQYIKLKCPHFRVYIYGVDIQ
jgi:hypothetical protein